LAAYSAEESTKELKAQQAARVASLENREESTKELKEYDVAMEIARLYEEESTKELKDYRFDRAYVYTPAREESTKELKVEPPVGEHGSEDSQKNLQKN